MKGRAVASGCVRGGSAGGVRAWRVGGCRAAWAFRTWAGQWRLARPGESGENPGGPDPDGRRALRSGCSARAREAAGVRSPPPVHSYHSTSNPSGSSLAMVSTASTSWSVEMGMDRNDRRPYLYRAWKSAGSAAASSPFLAVRYKYTGCCSRCATDHCSPRMTGVHSSSCAPRPYAASRTYAVQWSVTPVMLRATSAAATRERVVGAFKVSLRRTARRGPVARCCEPGRRCQRQSCGAHLHMPTLRCFCSSSDASLSAMVGVWLREASFCSTSFTCTTRVTQNVDERR
jgi:hypothetical protein